MTAAPAVRWSRGDESGYVVGTGMVHPHSPAVTDELVRFHCELHRMAVPFRMTDEELVAARVLGSLLQRRIAGLFDDVDRDAGRHEEPVPPLAEGEVHPTTSPAVLLKGTRQSLADTAGVVHVADVDPSGRVCQEGHPGTVGANQGAVDSQRTTAASAQTTRLAATMTLRGNFGSNSTVTLTAVGTEPTCDVCSSTADVKDLTVSTPDDMPTVEWTRAACKWCRPAVITVCELLGLTVQVEL